MWHTSHVSMSPSGDVIMNHHFGSLGFGSFNSSMLTVSRSALSRSSLSIDMCPSQSYICDLLRDFRSLSPSTLEILQSDFPLLPRHRSSYPDSFPMIYGVDLIRKFVPQCIPLRPTVELRKASRITFLHLLWIWWLWRNFIFPSRSYDSNTPSVERSHSMVNYHPDCGFIIPLLLLSFIIWPSNPLALKNILRLEIGSI